MEHKDQQEKAILLLLWGKKGWKPDKGLRHIGFSMENLLKFLRAKRGLKRGDIEREILEDRSRGKTR
jgi:hypothetical protein